jgi:pyruvate ferredoxin oxidoreductase gamma subunit
MSQMTEFRWHGRAGQGVVTAGELLAEAAMEEGKYFQAFPEYGSERMGAPIKSYTRISDTPIEFHCPILEPDVVIVVNPNLLAVKDLDLTEGLKPDGIILINTPQTPDEIRKRLKRTTGKVWCVDATKIAVEEFKRDIPSTMMLSLVARATGVIHLDAAIELTREKLGGKLRPEVVEANVRTLQRAYDECAEG